MLWHATFPRAVRDPAAPNASLVLRRELQIQFGLQEPARGLSPRYEVIPHAKVLQPLQERPIQAPMNHLFQLLRGHMYHKYTRYLGQPVGRRYGLTRLLADGCGRAEGRAEEESERYSKPDQNR